MDLNDFLMVLGKLPPLASNSVEALDDLWN